MNGWLDRYIPAKGMQKEGIGPRYGVEWSASGVMSQVTAKVKEARLEPGCKEPCMSS